MPAADAGLLSGGPAAVPGVIEGGDVVVVNAQKAKRRNVRKHLRAQKKADTYGDLDRNMHRLI